MFRSMLLKFIIHESSTFLKQRIYIHIYACMMMATAVRKLEDITWVTFKSDQKSLHYNGFSTFGLVHA